jgi:hypothetical protein
MPKKKPKIRQAIQENAKDLRVIMDVHLTEIADGLISQIMGRVRRLIPSERLDAIRNIELTGVQEYKGLIQDAMVVIAENAIDQARKEVPKAKKVKLEDTRLSKLPPKLRDKIKTRSQLLVGKQIGDLQKVIEFAYATAEDTTDSDDQLEADLKDSAIGWLDGTAVETGSVITSATIINEARNSFFYDDDVLDEIDAFEFVNGDPVSPICQDLAGTVFEKDDPDAFRYTPPLHWNCKSYIVPILKGNLGDRETEKLRPSKAELEDSIQFAEHRCSEHDPELRDLFECIKGIE